MHTAQSRQDAPHRVSQVHAGVSIRARLAPHQNCGISCSERLAVRCRLVYCVGSIVKSNSVVGARRTSCRSLLTIMLHAGPACNPSSDPLHSHHHAGLDVLGDRLGIEIKIGSPIFCSCGIPEAASSTAYFDWECIVEGLTVVIGCKQPDDIKIQIATGGVLCSLPHRRSTPVPRGHRVLSA